jgi:DNA-binding GntR family transcriptional regulator
LVDILGEEIASGVFKPGDCLPPESQLCKYHDISPMTVRRAINILSENGTVITEQGRGTFVKSIQFWNATFDLCALQQMVENKNEAKINIIGTSIIPADAIIADKLALKIKQKVLFIRRLIYLRDKPFLYHQEYLVCDPTLPIIESAMDVTSLRGLFKGNNNSWLKRSKITLKSVLPNQEESGWLGISTLSPALRLEHVFYDFKDRPVSWGWFVCPGDQLQFTAWIGAQNVEKAVNV